MTTQQQEQEQGNSQRQQPGSTGKGSSGFLDVQDNEIKFDDISNIQRFQIGRRPVDVSDGVQVWVIVLILAAAVIAAKFLGVG